MPPAQTSLRQEWPLALAGLVAVAGLFILTFDGWRRGAALIAAGVLLAGFLRLVLSDDRAGLLRVRGRTFDIFFLGGVGAVIFLLAVIIPN
ncbi:DUF3017 domain-containing protein [Kribbella sp. NBC_01245]|uniref:DUF3017 domain-containing protein n=1 Tax=Kribbella sp. NBC_01245 TaxID=2903578 RepID=UPI002E2E81D1|nr:DUF3017 domain-containing protein [Kribbella sp. NBC_01245]